MKKKVINDDIYDPKEMYEFIRNMFKRFDLAILNDDTVKQYDYVIIDCNPSLGVLLMNALTASSGVIIPVQVQDFAFGGLKNAYRSYYTDTGNNQSGFRDPRCAADNG